LLDRQIGRLGPVEDLPDVNADPAIYAGEAPSTYARVSYIERADNRHRVHQHQPGAPLSISPKCLSNDAAPGDRVAVGTGDREIALGCPHR